jgi:hypothetical protein
MMRMRESVVVSRPSVISVRLAGLERVQRFAGESFGHEELTIPAAANGGSLQTRLFWSFAGLASFVALGAILLH